jgi:hypothetical protein
MHETKEPATGAVMRKSTRINITRPLTPVLESDEDSEEEDESDAENRDILVSSLTSSFSAASFCISTPSCSASSASSVLAPSVSASAIDTLPPFPELAEAKFQWGERSGADISKVIGEAYESTVLWRKNLFDLPGGTVSKHFVAEVARLNLAFADRSPLEGIAIKASMVIIPLLLQKPHAKSKSKEHVECLKRRLSLWLAGNIKALVREGETIQARLKSSKTFDDDAMIAKKFSAMMFKGNSRGAMRYVSDQTKGGVLPLNESTRTLLAEKHPVGEDASPEVLIKGEPPPDVDPIAFAALDGDLIKKCALRTQGAAGVSHADDRLWHRMSTSFKSTSNLLCDAVAAVTRRIATEYVDPRGLEALLANRGIPLDKCPGLRPVGIGEVQRRIMGKAIMIIVGDDVQEAAGATQLCAGQCAGVEAAIHAMRELFGDLAADGMLLIDADNAFNRVNRKAALLNIKFTCPIFKFTLINMYRTPSRIFVVGGLEMVSREGTTQGCPLAMAMYALALVPLTLELHSLCKQVWYADDGTGCDKLKPMRDWWDALVEKGPAYGYFPKAVKTWLIVKEERLEEAQQIFHGSGVQITTEGMRHLGAAIGSDDFKSAYIMKKIDGWVDNVERLSVIAKTEPHAAFSAFTRCLQSRWTFVTRTIPNAAKYFEPLEKVIREKFIPALLGREVNDLERELFSLPARHAGLGIFNPCTLSDNAFTNSEGLSAPLTALVLAQERMFDPAEMRDEQKKIQTMQKAAADKRYTVTLAEIEAKAPAPLKLAIKLARIKGASSWVTAMPLLEQCTVLHKGDFRDAIYLRYGWTPLKLPDTCTCGSKFSVEHSLSCLRGGFRTLMHNEVMYVYYDAMKEAGYKDVTWEPELQPLTGEKLKYKTGNSDDEARSDIRVLSFWKRMRRAFFDVTAFSPYASSYSNQSMPSLFRKAEQNKKRQYNDRILNVEHADFTPMVFATSGGMGPQASIVTKRLCEKLAEKQDLPISVVSGWLRCRVSFALLRSTLICLRGTRGYRPMKRQVEPQIELAVAEARIEPY